MENLLKNNSNDMKTIVETYIMEETEKLIYDNEELEKWNNFVETLNLEGQKQIITKEKSPIPFMHLKTSLVNVFETLCPSKVNVEEYNITPIPVEILDLISLSKNEDYFSKIQIWYDEKSPDPACIGIIENWCVDDKKGNRLPNISFKTKELTQKYIDENNLADHKPYNYSWNANTKHYLLGRWADVKHSFKELKEMAKERFMNEEKIKLLEEKKKINRQLEDLELEAEKKFN